MATLMVPPLDAEPWPTLGNQVADWLEANAVYGPGTLAGQPYRCTAEFRAQLCRAYEVFPRGHRLAGRRRFAQAFLEERKGKAKTERAALVAIAEAHPDAPVRFTGWRKVGRSSWEPADGRGIGSPYVPLVAFTLEQTEDLAYHVAYKVIEEAPALLADNGGPFDIGLDRINVLDGRGRAVGKIVALAGSPNARDGARTTFQHFDEPHRMSAARLKKAHSTMVENTYKRVAEQPWTLYTSTAGEPGEESVAEDLRELALAIDAGHVSNPRLFYFSRYAPIERPLDTPAQVRDALVEASGPDVAWSADIDGLVDRYFAPKTDRPYFCRVWLNQWRQGSGQVFDPAEVAAAARPGARIPAGALVTVGFDGSKSRDATAIIVTEVATGLQVTAGVWEKPEVAADAWEVPRAEVDEVLAALFDRFDVWRMYADPFRWGPWLASWAGTWGDDRVVTFDTTKVRRMAAAIADYRTAFADGDLTHDADPRFVRHLLAAIRRKTELVDDEGLPLHVMAKDARNSRRWIDAAMAGCLSWRARTDAVTEGATSTRKTYKAVGL